MKIIPENIINSNRSIANKQNASENKQASGVSGKPSDYDKLTIASSEKTGVPDAQFIAQLKKSIMSEIQAGAPERKLDALKRQIALDEYDINIPDVVRKIMLDAPEAIYE